MSTHRTSQPVCDFTENAKSAGMAAQLPITKRQIIDQIAEKDIKLQMELEDL